MHLDATAANAHDAVRLLKARGFDLVVLCHTLSVEQMTLISRLAHQHNQETQVLKLVSAIFRGTGADVEADYETPSEPHKLVANVRRILTN
jgi:DNA-binding response OmpR family regulator